MSGVEYIPCLNGASQFRGIDPQEKLGFEVQVNEFMPEGTIALVDHFSGRFVMLHENGKMTVGGAAVDEVEPHEAPSP